MITAGIDVGSQSIKALLLKEDGILSWSLMPLGHGINDIARAALADAMERGGIADGRVDHIISTGVGRSKVRFADGSFVDLACDAKGAVWLYPSARTVIDVGAEECRALQCDGSGRVVDFYLNDKCAASVGMFLEVMAKVLGIPLQDAGSLSLCSQKDLSLSTSCVVFAESEVVSLIHAGEKEADVMRAVHMAVASTAAGLARRVGVVKDVVLVGGAAQNAGFVDCLRGWIDTDLLCPETPQIVGALGAALMAME